VLTAYFTKYGRAGHAPSAAATTPP
jgi:hypothetical protein